jgi:RimJ/RimL family protein N-acetyltransferase
VLEKNHLKELNRSDYERVRPLFRKMDIHLPLQAILAGNVSAPIYVDNPLHPQTALTWVGSRFYLAGSPGNTDLIAAARKIFLENFAMSAWKAGIESYIVHYPTEKWEIFVKAMLQQKYPILSARSYFSCKASRGDLPNLPEGFSLRSVDAALLAGKWRNLDFLTDELVSERESVQDFLAKSFGVCLTQGDLIAGWCLSEFNTGHRCELGVATHEDFQEQGFATLMTRAFIEIARTRDVANIGWHCSTTNLASSATALKAGFEKVEDYPVFIGWFDDVTNIARNGYFAHGRGEYAEALAFYEKSFSYGEVPDRVYWGAACDAALIGQSEKALKYLAEAVRHGFDDREQLENSKYLVSLHDTEGWNKIINSLG